MTTAVHGPLDGPSPRNRLPKQDVELVMKLSDKFVYAVTPHEKWATRARQAVDFVEGRQWTDAQRIELKNAGRPDLQFNKIAPLVRLVMGYHANNRIDVTYLPGHDGTGTEQVAEVLSMLVKQIGEMNQLGHIDGEVFMDGLIAARGYWRHIMGYEHNAFGEVKVRSLDPFSVFLDPDGDTYDLNDSCSFIQYARWTSIDEIEFKFGRAVADACRPLARGDSWNGFASMGYGTTGDLTAERTFAEEEDGSEYASFRNLFNEHFVDTARKTLRVIETEYYVTQMENHFVDLETGDMKRIPGFWKQDKIQKALMHAESLGNPLAVQKMPCRRLRWVQMVGDVIVHNDWSPYETFSINGFFPYFRRGKTRSMVDDLIDPQLEYNKKRIARMEILQKTANGGSWYEEGSLDPQQESRFKKYGSSAGFIGKYRDGKQKPEENVAQSPPAEFEKLEEAANNDLKEISGVNDSALGQLDRVQSGRALEARQRQTVIGLQLYMDNFARSKELQGRKLLNLVQRFYTEDRIFRIMGEDGQLVQMAINQPRFDGMQRLIGKLNDITIGKYEVVVDETPMSASFQGAQFDEAMAILEKLQVGPERAALMDILIDLSSMPRKDEVKERLQQAMGLVADPMAPQLQQAV